MRTMPFCFCFFTNWKVDRALCCGDQSAEEEVEGEGKAERGWHRAGEQQSAMRA